MIVVAAGWTIRRSKVDAQSYARFFVLHQEEDLGHTYYKSSLCGRPVGQNSLLLSHPLP